MVRVAFDSLEEYFYLPPVPVDVRNGECTEIGVVRNELYLSNS